MNNNQHFDKNIREQFSNFAPDVHPRIWENIIAEKEKRRPAGFWFTLFNSRNILVLLGILLAGGSGAWLLNNHYSNMTDSKKNTATIIKKEAPVYTIQPVSPVDPAKLIIEKEPTISPDANVASNKPGNILSLPGSTPLVLSSGPSMRINTKVPSLQSDKTENFKDKNKYEVVANGRLKSPDNMAVKTIPLAESYSGNGSLLGRLLFEAHKIRAQVSTSTTLEKRNTPFWLLPDCPSMEKDAAGNKKYIEIYGGPDIVFRKLSDTGNSVYLQKRKESTKFASAYSAGIRYTRVFNNSMSVRTGLNYSQINEKFTYVQGNLVQITYIIDANGDTTGSYITTGTRYKTTHNKYRSIDVPLLVGYEIGNGKLHANINAGAVVNIYSWQRGEVLDTALRPVSITTGKSSAPYQFKTNAGVGFMAAASVYYKLNDKVHIMAEPYFRYNFSPMNKENLTLKQKYSTAGLRVGLRVDLK